MLEKVCKPVGLGFLSFLWGPVSVHIAKIPGIRKEMIKEEEGFFSY